MSGNKKKLISEEYRKLQNELHITNDRYGEASLGLAGRVAQVIDLFGVKKILDYGCGKGRLGKALRKIKEDIEVIHYDPAIPEWSESPDPCEFVACIDVLEHIEPEFLDNVLEDLARVTLGHGFFSISTVMSSKFLSDGRNAHLIVKPAEWWKGKIEQHFTLVREFIFEKGVVYIVSPKIKPPN